MKEKRKTFWDYFRPFPYSAHMSWWHRKDKKEDTNV